MTPADMADVLSAAGIYDERTIAEADVAAWHAAAGQYDREDALAAVVRHYTDSTEWMKPAHLKQHILAIRNERASRQQHPVRELPSRFEADDVRDTRIARGLKMLAQSWTAAAEEAADTRGIALARARRERGKRPMPTSTILPRRGGKPIDLDKLPKPEWADEAAREVRSVAALHEANRRCGRPVCPREECRP